MATVKVSALTETTSPQANDELLINQSGVSKKVKITNLPVVAPASGSIATAMIADNAITSAKLGVDVIVAEDIANNAITVAELANNAVTTVKILDDNVTYAKIQNVSATNRILGRDSASAGVVEEITPANLRTMINVEDGATADQTAAQIKTALENGIDSVHYVDGSIDNDHLAANSVDSDNYVDASIDNAHLADDAVGVAELSASGTASSTTFLRGDNAWAVPIGGVTSVNSVTGAVTATHLKTALENGIDSVHYVNASIDNEHLADDAVGVAELSATGTASSSTFLRGDNTWTAIATDANETTKGLYEHAHTIASNYVISSGNNAMSAGAITINSNISVTIPSGSTWVIA